MKLHPVLHPLLVFLAFLFDPSALSAAQVVDAAGRDLFVRGDGSDQTNEEEQLKESRIVGGEKARKSEFPYYVQGEQCGGSLIWEDIVLSAAHCESSFQEDAYVGAYEYPEKETHGTEKIPIKKTAKHPKFNGLYQGEVPYYDFMVALLKWPSNEQPVMLRKQWTPSIGENLSSIGTGARYEGLARYPRFLQKVDMKYVSLGECKQTYGNDLIDTRAMACAIGVDVSTGVCHGDSGSPLLDASGELVGMVSWSQGCARWNVPAVYSRVSSGYRWINKQVCKLSKSPPLSCKRRRGNSKKNKNKGYILRGRRQLRRGSGSSSSSRCVDTDELFDLGDIVLDRDCEWLASNRFYEEDLCEYPHIRYRCPRTCDAC